MLANSAQLDIDFKAGFSAVASSQDSFFLEKALGGYCLKNEQSPPKVSNLLPLLVVWASTTL